MRSPTLPTQAAAALHAWSPAPLALVVVLLACSSEAPGDGPPVPLLATTRDGDTLTYHRVETDGRVVEVLSVEVGADVSTQMTRLPGRSWMFLAFGDREEAIRRIYDFAHDVDFELTPGYFVTVHGDPERSGGATFTVRADHDTGLFWTGFLDVAGQREVPLLEGYTIATVFGDEALVRAVDESGNEHGEPLLWLAPDGSTRDAGILWSGDRVGDVYVTQCASEDPSRSCFTRIDLRTGARETLTPENPPADVSSHTWVGTRYWQTDEHTCFQRLIGGDGTTVCTEFGSPWWYELPLLGTYSHTISSAAPLAFVLDRDWRAHLVDLSTGEARAMPDSLPPPYRYGFHVWNPRYLFISADIHEGRAFLVDLETEELSAPEQWFVADDYWFWY